MPAWSIPKGEVELAAWMVSMPDDRLDAFVTDMDYLLEEPSGGTADQLVMATIVGAARRWRDDRVNPLTTLRANAPEGFYDED